MIEGIVGVTLFFLFYAYAGYPLLLWALTRRRPCLNPPATAVWPTVSVVMAAHNEAAFLRETISSILASSYPSEALEVVVVSDASTDQTAHLARCFPPERVRVVAQTERKGQAASLKRGAALARGEILILADASGTFFPDTVPKLVRHFVDPQVGGVSGHKDIRKTGGSVAGGDRYHFRYDSTLREMESRLGSSWVGCQGGLFAFRKSLFTMDFPTTVAPDNAFCYRLYERGYRHLFDPAARVLERPSTHLGSEFRRKIRIVALQLQGVKYFRHLFNPWRHPLFFFQNVSHKIFRWLVPFALLLLWSASGQSEVPLVQALFYAQCVFYGCAGLGVLIGRNRKAPALLAIPAYFVTVNLAGLSAWASLSEDYSTWTPPLRTH
jgi:biofilm PGA synthesis N-glycosyltransferase PgaC